MHISESRFTGALIVGSGAGGGGCGGNSPTAGGNGGKGGSAEGGAIYNAGTLTVTRSRFVDNRAQGGFGGFGGCGGDNPSGPGGPGGKGASGGKGKGGAIYNTGALTVTYSTFIGNEAIGGDGGLGGAGGSDASGPGDGGVGGDGGAGGKGGDARGGAIYSGPSFTLETTGQGTAPTLQVSHSTFRRNTAVGGAGGGSGGGGNGASEYPLCEVTGASCGTAGAGGDGGPAGAGGDATGGAVFAGDIQASFGAKAKVGPRNRFDGNRVVAGGPGSNTDCGVASDSGGPCYGLSGVDGLGAPAAANGQDGSPAGPGAAQDRNVFNLYG